MSFIYLYFNIDNIILYYFIKSITMFALNGIIIITMFAQSRKHVNTFYIVQYVTYYNI